MSRERLLDLSRKVSEIELEARQVRHASGITDALGAVQQAIARRIDRIEAAEREEPPPVAAVPDASAVRAAYQVHLASAGHGGQARMARLTGIPPSTLAKFANTGQMGNAQLARLATALDQAERDRRPS